MPVQVFVSYARKDQSIVKEVVSFLETQFVVWWDDDLVGGTDFAKDIFGKIDRTQVTIVCWSAQAAASEWVKNESLVALERCRTIPILLDDEPLPAHLSQLDAIDLRSWVPGSDSRELRKLAQDIQLHLMAVRKPLVRAESQSHDAPVSTDTDGAPGHVGCGLLLYLFAIPFCLWMIDWKRPFDNKFVLAAVAVANFPLIIFLASQVVESAIRIKWPRIYGISMPRVPFTIGLSWGGLAVAFVIPLIVLSSCHDMSVRSEIAKFDSRRYSNHAGCTPVDVRYHLAASFGAISGLRRLSGNEAIVALGCVDAEWQNPTDQTGFRSPPFTAEFPSDSAWSKKAEVLLLERKYDAARLLLLQAEDTDPAARNLLGVLDAFEFGHGARKELAFRRFREAAASGSKVALANLGICYVFGFGISMDPIYGSELIKRSINEGVPATKALWLLRNGFSLLQATDFAELVKTIRIEAARGSHVASAIEGVLATQGLAKDPCAPKCSDVAKHIAGRLRSMGQETLAAIVDMNANAERGQDAVDEAARLLPEPLQKTGVERYLSKQRKLADEENRRQWDEIMDPTKRKQVKPVTPIHPTPVKPHK